MRHGFPSNFVRTSKYTCVACVLLGSAVGTARRRRRIISFLPKTLYEQFRKVSNMYFLLNLLIQLIPGVTPLPPVTTALPLVFVVTASAIREAFEVRAGLLLPPLLCPCER